ncbi:hypothetical protein [Desulfococcus sp.]|uniref:Uncharacterized protein n=1 Tax=Desulfococcus multivorans DSM 2059 TaxID=1121405 RepID=S7VI29_DESML|nr:hypothetical protein dsmv_1118 [Desulfococcus multivorans DSM 2059]SJZ78149.1 hypothetical protein SAMN02745446_01638 [Desulfococcus multivorans DSM 2059]
MMKRPRTRDQGRGWSIPRCGFLASAGTGAVCLAVSGSLFASRGVIEEALDRISRP